MQYQLNLRSIDKGLVLSSTLAVVVLAGSLVGTTVSSFFNGQTSAANVFTAGTWESAPPVVVESEVFSLSIGDPVVEFVAADTPPSDSVPDPGAGDPPTVTLSDTVVVDPPADTPPAESTPTVELGDTTVVQ